MDLLKDSLETFGGEDMTKKYEAIIEAVNIAEKELKIKIPTKCYFYITCPYLWGNIRFDMGKIHNFYLLGMELPDGNWRYEIFKNKNLLRMFFTKNIPDTLQKSFWYREVELLPN
jgi:hypothetical protein